MDRTIQKNDRGAIMVIALFFAIFGVAMLYSLIGTAQAIFLREKLQDAADSAAMSGAIVHARGMNLLVLINIVMAALLAILVILKAVESVAILGIILAAALAWITGGASLSAVAPLKTLQQLMHEKYDALKPPIFDALATLHSAADAVAEVAPIAGIAIVEADIATHSAPALGFVAPPRLTLPVEDDAFSVLCGQAGALPGQIAKEALDEAGIPVVPKLTGLLADGVGALAKSFSGWFCSDPGGGGDAPKLSQTVQQSYPKAVTVDSETCGRVDDSNKGPSVDEVRRACERSQAEEDAGKPDEQTGECRRGVDCSVGGPYEQRLKLAREQCDPLVAPWPFAYWYQQRNGHVDYEWTAKGWQRHDPQMSGPVRVGGTDGTRQVPCGPKAVQPVAVGYNKIVHPHDDLSETLPACTTEVAPLLPPLDRRLGTIASQDFTEVTQILGCQKSETKDIPITPGTQAGQQSNDKSPKRLEKDVALGDKNFQMRAVMWAQPTDGVSKVVRLALWGNKQEETLGALRPLRGFAVAQAEYFYDGGGGSDAWMWNMNWRGRLRRFRLEDKEFEIIDKACQTLPEETDCEGTLTALANIASIVNH